MLITVHHLIDNQQNNFLILGEGATDGINDAAEKKLLLTFVKQIQNFA